MCRRVAVILAAAVVTAACGSSPAAPTPAPTATSITISSSSDMMRVGTNEVFTAIVTESDGKTVPPGQTAIWSTDNLTVAIIDNVSGLLRPIGAGTTTVILDYQGKRGTKAIRVVPDFQARWFGTWTRTGCGDGGVLAGFCGSASAPTNGQIDMTLSQTRDSAQGTASVGAFPFNVTGQIGNDGTLGLVGSGTVAPFAATINAFQVRLPSPNTMTGTMTFTAAVNSGPIGFTQISLVLQSVSRF